MNTSFRSIPRLPLALALAMALSPSAFAQDAMKGDAMKSDAMGAPASAMKTQAMNPRVGGAAMYTTRDIVDNAVNSKDHTTLVAAVKAAGLVPTLKSAGPFTVFAPTNAAFNALPAGTVEALLLPENKDQLTQVLTYHVVAGKLDAATLLAKIRAGGGEAHLTTVEGEHLIARKTRSGVSITDARGDVAQVTIADVRQSNGIIHVIDTVLLPAPSAPASAMR